MAIETKRNPDGTWTVFYFDKEAGYINRIATPNGEKRFRAVSVHGRLTHSYTFEGAKHFIIENFG